MAYNHTTFAAFKSLLALRLGDPANVYWLNTVVNAEPTELSQYTIEALRTWQALTSYFRSREVFNLDTGVAFYDLTSKLSSAAVLGQTVRDREIISAIEYHLAEPQGLALWAGTEMFTLDGLTKAIERARNRFLDDTGIYLERDGNLPVPAGNGRVDLSLLIDDTVTDIVRAQWVDSSGRYYNIWKSDEQYANSYRSKWTLYPGIPYGFSVVGSPQLSMQLTPPPLSNGFLDIVSTKNGAALDPTTVLGVLLGIPDNYAWVVKWGAIADLLGRDGQAFDPERFMTAKKLYEIGVEIAKQTKVIVNIELDGRPVKASTLAELDSSSQGWQGKKRGTPTDVAIISQNLIAVKPVPDSSSHSVLIDVITNATLPVLDTDYIQVGREYIDPLLDFCEFLACFKIGLTERVAFDNPHLQRFITAAKGYNSKLEAALRSAGVAAGVESEDLDLPRRREGRGIGAG